MKSIFTCITSLFLLTGDCFADIFDTIQDLNTTRAAKYNGPLNTINTIIDPMDLSKLSEETRTIDTLLTKNINTKIRATKEQQKQALQAVFSAEIIYGSERQSYLDGIQKTDVRYGHFYVLEYSALMAREALSQSVNLEAYKTLCMCSGLEASELFQWFLEMKDQHMSGKQARQERKRALKPVGATSENNTSSHQKTRKEELSFFIKETREQAIGLAQLPPDQLANLGSTKISLDKLAEYAKQWNQLGILPAAPAGIIFLQSLT